MMRFGLLAAGPLAVVALGTVTASAASWVTQRAAVVITMQAAPGDGGNAWGGHQTRIVRTPDGVFTTFLVNGSGYYDKRWRLVHETSAGQWETLLEDSAGREPANLLAEPDGSLDVVAYPGGVPTLWRVHAPPSLSVTKEVIPGLEHGDFPYNAAGIDATGRLCVVVTNGGGIGGTLDVACRRGARRWATHRSETDFRFAYDYVFPMGRTGIAIVGTRDVVWSALGAETPAGGFDYAFTAAGVYRAGRIRKDLSRVDLIEEAVTADFPNPLLDAQMDAYVDRGGRIHELYWRSGKTTGGNAEQRHRVVSRAGVLVADVALPDIGWYQRLLQDDRGRFFLVGSNGFIQRLRADGFTPFGAAAPIDLGGHEVEYSGMALASPRTGTAASSTVDIVFPTAKEVGWVYVRLDLP